MLDNHGGGTRCINTGRRNTKGSSHLDLDVRFAAAQELDDKPNGRSQEGQQLTKYLGPGGRLPGPTMRETRVAIHLSGLGQPQSPSITYPSHDLLPSRKQPRTVAEVQKRLLVPRMTYLISSFQMLVPWACFRDN
jgi:hypothetical protein